MSRITLDNLTTRYAVLAQQQANDIVAGLSKGGPTMAIVGMLLMSAAAIATPTTGGDAALTTVGDMFKTAMTLGLALVAAVIFIIVAWAVVTKFNDARRGRADWGEVVLPFIIGAGVVIFVGWLVTEGTTAVGNIGTTP